MCDHAKATEGTKHSPVYIAACYAVLVAGSLVVVLLACVLVWAVWLAQSH